MGMFSIQTITALVEVVTGGAGFNNEKPIGVYRSGTELEQFMGGAGVELYIGMKSRVPSVRAVLVKANDDDPDAIVRVLENVADPREYLKCKDKPACIVEYLNMCLRIDGYELQFRGGKYRLGRVGTSVAVTVALADAAERLKFESVNEDFDRALKQADEDPEDAITSACATLESVCKCILDEEGLAYPTKQDIGGLSQAIETFLELSPARQDIEPDVKRILGGLANVTRGIGSLRTHCGDAHGKGKNVERVDSRIARLAIHSASTIALFYIDTWIKMK
jgi:hypothetical protein